MPDRRTSQLPPAGTLTPEDELALVQTVAGGTKETRRAALAALRAYLGVDALEARIVALEGGGGTSTPSTLGTGTFPFVLGGGGPGAPSTLGAGTFPFTLA